MINSVDVKRHRRGDVGVVEREDMLSYDSEHDYYYNIGEKVKPFKIEKKLNIWTIVKL